MLFEVEHGKGKSQCEGSRCVVRDQDGYAVAVIDTGGPGEITLVYVGEKNFAAQAEAMGVKNVARPVFRRDV